MKFYSEKLNQLFDTEKALVTAEKAQAEKEVKAAKARAEKEAKEKALKAKREVRAKEVETAFEEVRKAQEKAQKLLEDFCKDYGAFHYSMKDVSPSFGFNSLLDLMLNHF